MFWLKIKEFVINYDTVLFLGFITFGMGCTIHLFYSPFSILFRYKVAINPLSFCRASEDNM